MKKMSMPKLKGIKGGPMGKPATLFKDRVMTKGR